MADLINKDGKWCVSHVVERNRWIRDDILQLILTYRYSVSQVEYGWLIIDKVPFTQNTPIVRLFGTGLGPPDGSDSPARVSKRILWMVWSGATTFTRTLTANRRVEKQAVY